MSHAEAVCHFERTIAFRRGANPTSFGFETKGEITMSNHTATDTKTKQRCDVCGNEYENTFTVTRSDRAGTFDSFECAIAAMAPECAHCGCKILGHGVERDGSYFCCDHCARQQGENELANPTGILS